MSLTLFDVKNNPNILTFQIKFDNGKIIILRPLEENDLDKLTKFLTNLSEQTREYYTLDSYDRAAAQEMCDAINKYDKLRFVASYKSQSDLIALFEYSFDIPLSDQQRFKNYNISLDSKTDCRLGPCLADKCQNQGIGSRLFPYLIEIAKRFGRERLILWGGVFKNNERAVKFYIKNGFKELGVFKNDKDLQSIDMVIDIN